MSVKLSRTSIIIRALAWFIPFMSLAQQPDPVLKELINKALEKSHSLNINNLSSEQVRKDQQLAKAVFIPKVTFSGSFTRLDDDITFDENTQNLLIGAQQLLIKEAIGLPFNSPFPSNIPLTEVPNLQDKNILRSAVDLDWILFSGFEARNAIKASKHKEASLNYLGIAERDKIALKIIETYDKLALVHASKKVLNTTDKYLKEQENYVKKAIENGLATPISRKKIELAQQQLASKELEFNQNITLLIEVLHQLTDESRKDLALLNPQLQSFSNITDSVEKRNEIKALEEAEQATIYLSKMEKSSFIPKIALKGHYEFIEDDLSLLDPKWFIGVGIRWNVFDGFESKLKSEKSILESQKYRAQIEEAEEMIALSIVKAQLEYESSLQNTKMIEKEIDLASATYTMVNKQYKNNLAAINDVLDALTDLEKANFKLQQSYFNQRSALTAMLHAKGVLKSFYN
ncbi:TolC family protein [Bizionia argentinensis JUB59]|uniref:TolC family protein n=1 Tax=Bizionia argentinensis JUB59 TaxID=1046627 RepID=G2EG99_9FLAO|nr:TolC family protein [Bizionia argentinensis]EGV42507.2 TolC family protein [Bizionia argentinensis JUB59]